MPWTDDYSEIPFLCDGRTRTGLDCGGLVMLVYRERLGVELPEYKGALVDMSMGGLRKAHEIIKAELSRWVKVDRPQEFDVVSVRAGGLDGGHVGIVCGRSEMLHIMHGINSTVTSFKGAAWARRVTGFYRYAR